MRPPLAMIAAALALGGALSGCVAAVIPLAAAGTIGKRKFDGPRKRQPAPAAAAVSPVPGERLTLLPAGSKLPPPSAASGVATPAPTTGWRALVRHVGRAMSSGASCADGTTAVLIDAGVAGAPADERDAAVTSLNALRTMGASVTFVAVDPTAARAALTGAGMAEPDMAVAAPAETVAIARRGCVVATGGGSRAAFTGLPFIPLPASAPAPVAAAPQP
ncbi:hypothetical protein [Sphingomonas radiodurans]|uniref:hypothetical protein n=1 Tax=Sphingomonas radiodurans TaxID=2890321 RepID=UPI001E464C54|nr:hypothetical protein [Sphingomonas radiodurans]WBH15410.1 hypothetical protein LLW23_11215 [Sphingomonas radiodurans]